MRTSDIVVPSAPREAPEKSLKPDRRTWRSSVDGPVARKESGVTDQERQKAEELIGRLELAVGQVFPRDGGNASLIAGMIQALNGLRSVLGLVRPH
jgi:hypothetical protein